MMRVSPEWRRGVVISFLALAPPLAACAPLPPMEPMPPRRAALPTTPRPTMGLPPDPWAHGRPTPTVSERGLHEQEIEETTEPAQADAPPPDLVADSEKDLSLEPQIKGAKAANVAAALRLVDRGRVLINQRQYDQALEQLQRALSVDPSNFYGYYYLAKANQATNNYSQAIAFANRATALGSQADKAWIARAYTLQGEIFEKVGRFPDARLAYKRAVAADPTNQAAYVGNNRLSPKLPTPTPVYEDPWR